MNYSVKPLYFCLFLALCSATAQAQHADHGLPSPDEIGSNHVSFEISCVSASHDNFNRGVALLHSFWFAEAISAFDQVLVADPNCAMAYWGIALSHWSNPFAGQRNSAQLVRGQEAVSHALATGSPTLREKAYISAVAELFADSQPGTQSTRTAAYENAMSQLVQNFPTDREARIFYALAVNQTASPNDKTFSKQLQAALILEPLFVEFPSHPGLAHYIIHAYDHPPLAEKALGAARRYASLAPAIPHALHMPSHTFTRVGLWQESIETNQRSADAARVNSTSGEELHALDYQAYAYLQMAQDKAAAAVLERALTLTEQINITAVGATSAGAFAIAAIPARYALERGAFDEAASLFVNPSDAPQAKAITHFARAIGAARSGNLAAAVADAEELMELREQLRSRQDSYWTEQVDIQWRAASAWIAFAAGNQEEGILILRAAAELEDGTDKSAVSPGPLAPARELLGMMLSAANRSGEALLAFEATMTKEPNRFLAMFGAAQAAESIGDSDKAKRYYQKLLEVAGGADTDRSELLHAREYLR